MEVHALAGFHPVGGGRGGEAGGSFSPKHLASPPKRKRKKEKGKGEREREKDRELEVEGEGECVVFLAAVQMIGNPLVH